jgi:hypothetical protein
MKFKVAVLLALTLALVACSVDQVLSDIDLVLQTANVVCSTIGVVAPADAAACAAISGAAIAGLTVVKEDYDTWKASGATSDLQKLEDAITTVKTNLEAELQAAHISDPNAVRVVTAWVDLVSSSLTAILNLLPQLQSNKAALNGVVTPESLKARWTAEVCGGNAQCGNLVTVHHVRK